jgi:hypothetical protein
MVAAKDALNRIVNQVQSAKPINVKHMVEERDVLNRIAKQVQ